MILTKPSWEFSGVNLQPSDILRSIEAAGRTCYKSEKETNWAECSSFVRGLISRGHESVLEHEKITVRVICDRGVSHELVRHRIASYSQESTRYCNYRGGVEFIIPPWTGLEAGNYPIIWKGLFGDCDVPRLSNGTADSWWFWACATSERDYMKLLDQGQGWKPQQARSVLPNSLKTEIVITQNIRQWRHFFKLRALGISGKPHPQMLEIAVPMLEEFQQTYPELFDDLIATED